MKKKGVKTIFVTSISRLKYDGETLLRTHQEYPKAMREVAKKLNDYLVDLEELTYEDLKLHDYEYNSKHYMILKPGEYKNYPEGKEDTTHLRDDGAKWICSLVVKELKKIEIVKDLFK